MITVHGRTRDQKYNGTADWKAIKPVKDAINIPLIVNGDINTPQDAIDAMEQSGADGVMIGRGSQGKPWMLKQVMSYMRDGKVGHEPSNTEKRDLILKHYDSILEYYGEHKGVPFARKHLSWYINGFDGAASFRNTLNTIKNPIEVRAKLISFFEGLEP